MDNNVEAAPATIDASELFEIIGSKEYQIVRLRKQNLELQNNLTRLMMELRQLKEKKNGN